MPLRVRFFADVVRPESVGVDLSCGQSQGFFEAETPCGNLGKSVVAMPYFTPVALG